MKASKSPATESSDQTKAAKHEPLVYRVEEIAQLLAISPRAAYNLCNTTKDFRVLRIGTSIRVDIDALCRIADNLISNLQKYADPAQPVCFEVTAEDDRFCVRLSNAVCATPQGDSHGVGLKNVAALMERMHGQSSYTIESRIFCITLHFSR